MPLRRPKGPPAEHELRVTKIDPIHNFSLRFELSDGRILEAVVAGGADSRPSPDYRNVLREALLASLSL